MNVLIVEDDIRLAQALARILETNGYTTDVVHTGTLGVEYGKSGLYDVIILDVMLPEKSGFAVTKELRKAHISTPVLLLTARDAITDKITGYDSGADDYMTKPFSPQELMAHLRALTRRQGEVIFETIAAGDLMLDLDSCELRCGDKRIHLSQKEFSLCKTLMTSPKQIFSKETLIANAWGKTSSAGDNNVEVYISFLRKKFAHLHSETKIETVRNVGYRLSIKND